MKIVFLDIDGTLADFASMSMKLLGFDAVDFKNLKRSEMTDTQKYQQELLFKTIDSYPEFFKEQLPYPWTKDMYNLCKLKFDKVAILSRYVAPVTNPENLSKVQKIKTQWIWNNIDPSMKTEDIIITPRPKSLFAYPNTWLIDDMIREVKKFNQNDGNGILFKDWETIKKLLQQFKGRQK